MTIENSSLLDGINQLLEKQLGNVDDIENLIEKADGRYLPGLESLKESEEMLLADLEKIKNEIPPGITENIDG